MKGLTTSAIALTLALAGSAAMAQELVEEEGLVADEGIGMDEGIGEEGIGMDEGIGADEGFGAGQGIGTYDEYGASSGVLDQGMYENMIRAENIIDSPIYSMATGYEDAEWNETEYYNEIDTNWEEIGSVEDMIMSRDGSLVGIVAEVGGWLGLGDEQVVLGLNDVRIVGDSVGSYAFVTRLSEERLESMPQANEGWYN